MADGFGYGSFSGAPYPFWLSSPSASPFPATYPSNLTQGGGFDPTISHGSYHRSPSDRSSNPSLTHMPSSSFYVNNGSYGPRGEDSYTYMIPPSGLHHPSSSDYLLETQRFDRIPYKSDMLIRNSQEPFYYPILSSGGKYHPGPPVVLPQALFDGSQTGVRLGDGRSCTDVVCSHAPDNIQSSLPLSENPDLGNETVGSAGLRSPRASHPLQFDSKSSEKRQGSGVSSLYQTPKTFLADSENGVSETSLENAIDDLNCDEHRSWNHFMVSSSEGPSAPTIMFSVGSESCVAMKADNGTAAQSAVNCKAPSHVQATEKQIYDMRNGDNKTTSLTDKGIKGSSKSNADDVSTGQLPERHLCDQEGFLSPASCPRVSSVVNAMHNLSEVLVYECFNNGSWLKPEQLENLDKVVENLTKCLKKSTGNKTITGEASNPTQAMHVSCPNVIDLNMASNVVAKDCEGFSVKPLDRFGLKEPVDKDKYENEMTQSIKNILASNFPDGEENHPQTLLYKSLWLETEAALCSSACMARYSRIKSEIDNLKLQNREISAGASTFMQEPFLNPQKPVSIIKHGSNSGNDIVTMSHAPQSFRFNSDSVSSVLSVMSRSFMGGLEQEHHENFKPDTAISGKIRDAIQQESPGFTTEEKHSDVIDRFQILKQQETKRKLMSQNCSEARIGDQEENPEASEVANIGRSSQMSDVMDRFKMLKRREAEQVEEPLNRLDTDSDSDKDQPRNKTQICDHLWESMMIIGGNSVKETCASTEEPSASGEGYVSPISDWEHVRKDN
ncbi:uncharacterized protein LOC103875359 isoform X2 [Brassica rapa]|uniref:uncharacterized protein LOC103875359 isoform X2 n=1 Tax=Brassica campestris TaxID=3711 RepID=UPI00142E3722|nr:uncharacterized protein LOC103875359 isoform X2 [Brassica rapa]